MLQLIWLCNVCSYKIESTNLCNYFSCLWIVNLDANDTQNLTYLMQKLPHYCKKKKAHSDKLYHLVSYVFTHMTVITLLKIKGTLFQVSPSWFFFFFGWFSTSAGFCWSHYHHWQYEAFLNLKEVAQVVQLRAGDGRRF